MGQLADCFQCLSLWVAAVLTPFVTREPAEAAVTWLALSGAACQLEALVGRSEPEIVGLYPSEEKEDTDGVLRTATSGHGGRRERRIATDRLKRAPGPRLSPVSRRFTGCHPPLRRRATGESAVRPRAGSTRSPARERSPPWNPPDVTALVRTGLFVRPC